MFKKNNNYGELVVHHAENNYLIEDLGGTQGITINGQRISGRHPLRDGDRVQLGELMLFVTTKALKALA
jgi:pSer/pThr/pTyr-binding forkhead associated (FHA) protein